VALTTTTAAEATTALLNPAVRATRTDWPHMFEAVFKEIEAIGRRGPRERLPKEEQARCAVYRWMYSKGADLVRVEAGYVDPDQPGQHPECDIHAHLDDLEYWMEIKCGTADYPGYIPKPAEQLAKWCEDIDKLVNHAPANAVRCFLLAGVRERGSRRQLYSDQHVEHVTARIRRSPGAVPVVHHQCLGPLVWRDMANAELVCRLWTW
jgi:hypothetical protein